MDLELKKNLMRLCREREWSITRLAKESGIPRATVHGWTQGKAPSIQQLKAVASILQVSIHHLMFGKPDPYEQPSTEILRELFSGDLRVSISKIEREK